MISKKVMVVDDDTSYLQELKETLILSGYNIVAIDDPDKVVETALKEEPDVILLDLKMPKKTGFQLADQIKHTYGLENIPVIGISGFFKKEYQGLLNLFGIEKYLQKPFQPLTLLSTIEEVLNKPH